MTKYEYITVFTSIIFGLATVNMLKIIAAMIHSDVKTRFYPIHTFWVFNLIAIIFLIWWDNLAFTEIKEIDFFHYLDLTGYAVILFVMSSLLLPYKDKTFINFRQLFHQNKRKFYLTGIILFLFDFFDLVLQNIDVEKKQGLPHLIFDLTIIGCFFTSLIVMKKPMDWFTAITFTLGVTTWFFFQIFHVTW